MAKDGKAGRPRVEIDWKEVAKLLQAGCSSREIAGFFGIDRDTLYIRYEQEFGIRYAEFSAQSKRKGDALLRAKQFSLAMDGNQAMLIWLGKNRLNQTDKKEINGTTTAPIIQLIETPRQINKTDE